MSKSRPSFASSRMPQAITVSKHRSGAWERDRKLTKVLKQEQKAARRAAAIQRAAAIREVKNIDRWSVGRRVADCDLDAVRYAREVVRRALQSRDHADHRLIEQLESAVARIELRVDADRLQIKPDDLAEIRSLTLAIMRAPPRERTLRMGLGFRQETVQ